MNDKPEAQLLPGHQQHWVWLVPFFVIVLVGIIVWRNLPEEGQRVVLYFRDAAGLEVDQTRLRYRGVDVGKVKAIELVDDARRVEVELAVHEDVLPLLGEKTRFWLVAPQINAHGIEGIDTLVSGRYITFRPGAGEPVTTFTALEDPPILDQPGVRFLIHSGLKHNIAPGADILYKQVAVGTVYKYRLFSDYVEFSAQIHAPYASLLRENSVFWEESGVEFEAGLTGISLSTAPLSGLLRGGIAFATPEQPAARAEPGSRFTLAEEPGDDWPHWRPLIELEGESVRSPEDEPQPPALLPAAAEPPPSG